MRKQLLVWLLVLNLVSSYVIGYTVNWNIISNIDSGMRSYECMGNVCSPDTISFLQEFYGTEHPFVFTGSGNPDYYALFFYPEDGCYVPNMMHIELDTSANWVSYMEFAKQDAAHCGSNIVNDTISAETLSPGETVVYGAYLQSAWSSGDPVVNFVPPDLEPYYNSIVNVRFYVNGYLQEERQVNVSWSSYLWQEFSFTPTEPGTYVLRIETDMNDDCKCLGSNTKYVESVVYVEEQDIPEFSSLGYLVVLMVSIYLLVIKRQ